LKFFDFLDNKYRNLSLDTQIEFSLAKEGYQQAVHFWVLQVRKFFKVARIITLPFEYLAVKIGILAKDIQYETRYAEIKANTERLLKAAAEAQKAGQPLPANPADLVAPVSATGAQVETPKQ